MDFQLWTNKAIQHLELFPSGKRFELKKLFQGWEWESIPSKDRKVFGRYFANEVREKRIPHVEQIDPDKKGNNKYIKK